MSKKCIIEKYLHKARFCGDKTIEVPYNDLTMMCHLALDSLQTSRWIPVSERLPEYGGYVLVVFEKCLPFVALYYSGVKKFSCEREEANPTHWMPLPELPGVE